MASFEDAINIGLDFSRKISETNMSASQQQAPGDLVHSVSPKAVTLALVMLDDL